MGGGSPKIPDPNEAAMAGVNRQTQLYPYEYMINSMSQLGQKGDVINPITGKPVALDFTGQGTADVQNVFQGQMAKTLLDIQQGMGPQFITQRLGELKQSDPTGYAAYQQLFDQIQQEANQGGPNIQLSTDTQNQIQKVLQDSKQLTPEELSQVQQGVRGNQVQSGLYLGAMPAQQEASAVVGALDQKQSAAQKEAQSFLQAGISPSDIQYRKTQQDMANLGAFISGQNPTAQFGSIAGAGQGAAPYADTGYSTPTMNLGQMASQGIQDANQAYGLQNQYSQSQANPYMAGLSTAFQGASTAANLGAFNTQSPYSPQTGPNTSFTANPSGNTGAWAQAQGYNSPNAPG